VNPFPEGHETYPENASSIGSTITTDFGQCFFPRKE
jgi:hypothetical protein